MFGKIRRRRELQVKFCSENGVSKLEIACFLDFVRKEVRLLDSLLILYKEVWYNMLYIIGIGIVVIMLDVIFSIASAIYKNKFYRVILLFFVMYAFVSSLFLVTDVLGGVVLGKYLGVMSYISVFYSRVTGVPLPFNVDLNVIIYLLFHILVVGVAYIFLCWLVGRLDDIGFKVRIDKANNRVLLSIDNNSYDIELKLEYLRITFWALLMTSFVVQLGLFYFWIYKNQLHIIYLYVWICACFLLVLVSMLFTLSMKGLVSELYTQLLFVNREELRYAINVFERYLNGEKRSLKLSEYDVNVQLFIEMGIFRIPTGISSEYIDNVVVYISEENLRQYIEAKNRCMKG